MNIYWSNMLLNDDIHPRFFFVAMLNVVVRFQAETDEQKKFIPNKFFAIIH